MKFIFLTEQHRNYFLETDFYTRKLRFKKNKAWFLAHLAKDHESLCHGAASVRPFGVNFFL